MEDTEVNINIYYLWVGKSVWIQTPKDATRLFCINDKILTVNNRNISVHYKQLNQKVDDDEYVYNVHHLMEKHIAELYPPESGYPVRLEESIETLFKHYDQMNYFFLFSCMDDEFFFQTLLYYRGELQPFGNVIVNSQDKSTALNQFIGELEKCLMKQIIEEYRPILCDIELKLKSKYYQTIPFPPLQIKTKINGSLGKSYKCENGFARLTNIPYNMRNSSIYIIPEEYDTDRKWSEIYYTEIHMDNQFWNDYDLRNGAYLVDIPKTNQSGESNYFERPITINFKTPTQLIEMRKLSCKFKHSFFTIHNNNYNNNNRIIRLRDTEEEWILSIPDDTMNLPSYIVPSWKMTILFNTNQDFMITVPFNWADYIIYEVKTSEQIFYLKNILKGKIPIENGPAIYKDTIDNIDQTIITVTEKRSQEDACFLYQLAIDSKLLKNNINKLLIYRNLFCDCKDKRESIKIDALTLLNLLGESGKLQQSGLSFDCLFD